MEYKGLLARLAEFFTEWNKRHAPANRVNCLRIEMTDHKINYVFNGQILCQISIDKARQMEELDSNPIIAERQLLLSILETTSNLATSAQLKAVKDLKERAEIIILLLRLYHALEEDVVSRYPEVRETFNRKYFQRIGDPQKRHALMEQVEDFRDELLATIQGDEVPVSRIEHREQYINQLSISELCILLNAARLESDDGGWHNDIAVASDFIRKLSI